MKKATAYRSPGFIFVVFSVFIFTILLSTLPGAVEAAPPGVQNNVISAIGNKLDSVERRLEKALMRYDGKSPAPRGMTGMLMAMTDQLLVEKKKLIQLLDTLVERRNSDTLRLDPTIESLGHYAVRINSLVQSWFQIPFDADLRADPRVLDALRELKAVAEDMVYLVQAHFDFVWDKVIPLRFVQALTCYPFMQSCEPHLDWDSIDASVDALNESLHGIGLRFWIKSVESYYMPWFSDVDVATGETFYWGDAKYEIEQVFPIPSPPPNPLPHDRRAHRWIEYMSTLFSDPSELLVWVFGRDSLVSREMNHHSASHYPNQGRSVIISAQNIFDPTRPPGQPALSPYHLTHELGHFFGVRHTWNEPTGINPYTLQPVKWADLWDLVYCQDDLGFPFSFSSRDDAESAACTYKNIEEHIPNNCHIDNRFGNDDSDMRCAVPFPGGSSYYSGEPLLKGLSFPTGMAEDPPVDAHDATYSFAWGLNVMGYYGRYNAHLWTPGRFSASQLDLVKGHTQHDVPITNPAYLPYTNLWSERSKLGD